MTAAYFETQYARAADPWGFTSKWYEQRKRALTVAALPRRRYRSGYEPGCSIGVLSEALAERCDRLLSTDLMPAAVERARDRVASDRVRFELADVREHRLPDGHDLVVLSEVLYYLTEPEVIEIVERVGRRLPADGHVIAAHWRHPVAEHTLAGDRADQLLREHSGLHVLGGYCDADLRLTVLGHDPTSVAEAEGLA